MTDQQTPPAEQIADLLEQLHDRVETYDRVTRYRTVRRGRRDVLVAEQAPHRTTGPGLLAQLGIVATADATATVQVWQWVPDPDDQCAAAQARARGEARECAHGRRVLVRTERRTVAGTVRTGAAMPGGSLGWDADGALSPMRLGGSPDPAEPIGDAWHTAAEILAELDEMKAELAEQGHRGSLVDVALDDEQAGQNIAARLRSFVARARVSAGYDAPIVTLRDVICPDCAGPLRVRADASTAVWCGGYVVVAAEGGEPTEFAPCGNRWPRHAWIDLLATTEPPEPIKPSRNDLSASQAGNGGRA